MHHRLAGHLKGDRPEAGDHADGGGQQKPFPRRLEIQQDFQPLQPLDSDVAVAELLNLIWSPVAFIDTASNISGANARVIANIYGTQQGLISKVRVKFSQR